MTLFMLDIETTGTDVATDAVLEIGIVEIHKPVGKAFYQPFKHYRKVLHHGGEPKTAFAKKYQSNLYAEANAAANVSAKSVRSELIEFFKSCGADDRDKVKLCGWNIGGFDLPFLHRKGYLHAPQMLVGPDGLDVKTGDHDYHIYELSGSIGIASELTGHGLADIKGLRSRAEAIGWGVTVARNEETPHHAINDCLRQLALLNGLIYILRGPELYDGR